TGPNETRELTLPDGSRVKLGAGARLTVDFDSEDRRVVLKTGEAHFAVTTDRRRPFHVTAGPVLLRVLGTEFDVRLERREVRIAVSQGEVEVNRKSTSGGASSPAARPVRQILSAGHALTLSERRGERLSYENATLGEVIEGMNLYSERPIVIADEPLRGIRITAAFSADQIATALAG